MPVYEINGQRFEVGRELSPEELQGVADAFAAQEVTPKEPASSMLPMLGSMGAAMATGGASLPITMAASALGGAAGEATRQAVEGEPMQPVEMAKEAALGAGGELLGAGLSRVVPKTISATKAVLGLEKQTPQQSFSLAERQAAQEAAQQMGTSIPASRMSGGLSQLLEGFGRTGIGEGRFIAADKQIADAMNNEVKNIVDSVTSKTMTDIEVGDAVKASVDEAQKIFQNRISPLYAKIDEIGGKVPVMTFNVKENANKLLDKAASFSAQGKYIGLEPEAVSLLKKTSSLKGVLSFQEAHELRSALLRQKRALGDKFGPDSEMTKLLNKTISDINNEMDTAAKALSPRLQKLYRGTSAEYKRVTGTLYDDVVVQMLNKNPERIGESISRKGNVTEVAKVRKALNEAKAQGVDVTELKNNMLQGYLKDITKGLDENIGNFERLGDKLKDRQFKRTFDAMLSDEPVIKRNLEQMINIAKITSKSNQPTIFQGRGGMGGILNTMAMVSGGAAGYAAAGATGAGAFVGAALISQALAAKAMTSPVITNLLLRAEQIANKQGYQQGVKFLQNSKPFSRWLAQETARSDFGPQFEE